MLAIRSLEITTVKNCTINCYPYCPQLKFREAYGEGDRLLSVENFRLALANTPKDVWISFSGFGEPFLNSRAMEMIEYAHAEGYPVELFSTMVGCKPDDVDRLARIEFKHFCLHLPDPKGIAQIPITDVYKETITRTLRTLQIHSFSVMNDHFVSNERAGNCDDAPPRRVKGMFRCQKLHTPQFVMLPNGDLVLCCMDWTLRHRMGNLLRQTFDDIENAEVFKRIARNQWALGGDTLCRSCQWARPLGRHVVSTALARLQAALGGRTPAS